VAVGLPGLPRTPFRWLFHPPGEGKWGGGCDRRGVAGKEARREGGKQGCGDFCERLV
jgi:hypothetical protein